MVAVLNIVLIEHLAVIAHHQSAELKTSVGEILSTVIP